jgi:hypothetical protein
MQQEGAHCTFRFVADTLAMKWGLCLRGVLGLQDC